MKLRAPRLPALLSGVIAVAILVSSCGGSGDSDNNNVVETVETGDTFTPPPEVNVSSEVAVDPQQADMLDAMAITPIGNLDIADSTDLVGQLIPAIFETSTEVSLRFAQSGAALVEQINDSLWLPEDIDVLFADCGTANAFFIPANITPVSADQSDLAPDNGGDIVMCHELTDLFMTFFGNEEQAFLASTFVLMHELGHALVSVLSLPVLGIEESYVDGIAAVLLGESGLSEGSLLAGWFFGSQGGTPFFDSHRAGPQRFGDLACWAVGADSSLLTDTFTNSLADMLGQGGRACGFEYQQQVSGFSAVLGPNIRGGLDILTP